MIPVKQQAHITVLTATAAFPAGNIPYGIQYRMVRLLRGINGYKVSRDSSVGIEATL